MDLHPWQLWTIDGQPVRDARDCRGAEGVMAPWPLHIGANHFYIHAVEASPDPGRALAAAQRLPKLAPAAGHIVHMPSHIIFASATTTFRTLTEAAIKADKIYLRERDPKGLYPDDVRPHNIQLLWAS